MLGCLVGVLLMLVGFVFLVYLLVICCLFVCYVMLVVVG